MILFEDLIDSITITRLSDSKIEFKYNIPIIETLLSIDYLKKYHISMNVNSLGINDHRTKIGEYPIKLIYEKNNHDYDSWMEGGDFWKMKRPKKHFLNTMSQKLVIKKKNIYLCENIINYKKSKSLSIEGFSDNPIKGFIVDKLITNIVFLDESWYIRYKREQTINSILK